MKILIVTQYFWPENFKINDLSVGLKEMGHDITILTGQPNYPEGVFFEGYSFSRQKHEFWSGIEVYRLPSFARGSGSSIKLMLNYLSFPFFGLLLWKQRLKKKEFDIIFVCQLSPIFVALPAILIKKRLEIPIVMWVLDIWPESVFAASNMNKYFLEKPLRAVVGYIYKACDLILISSKSFQNSICSFGINSEVIKYFPNWAEQSFLSGNVNEFLDLPDFSPGFNILFAGNIGEAQDIETIIEAAELLREHKVIKWIFLGDGRKRIWLQTEIIKRRLSDQVFWLGRYPITKMPYFFNKASVMLATLKKNPVFELTVPAKLQTYLASRKPIIALLSGEGNMIVQDAKCGFSIPSGDSKLLSEAASKMAALSNSALEIMAENGYQYYLKNFDKNILLTKLNTLLNERFYSEKM